ncbi:ABC transporter ATP-binding protein/permease [Eubacteriales bacterium OttesenSCG-928-M02]|nr:ABC transporter ATP-binding protein/permease [Eubacteriales bacterium OttesenSCG-928-M02]
MKRYWAFTKNYRWAFLLAPLLVVLDVIAEMFSPKLMSQIVDVGIANGDMAFIIKTGIMMVGLALFAVLANVGSVVFAARASQGFGAQIRKALYDKIQSFSFSEIDKFSTPSLITRLTNDVSTIQQTAMMAMRMMVRAPISFVTALIFAISISPKLSLIILGIFPALVIIIGVLLKLAMPLFIKMQERLDGLNLVVQENLTGVRVVKSLNRQTKEKEKFTDANNKLMETSMKAMKLMMTAMPIVMLLFNLAVVAILWFGGQQVSVGGLMAGELISLTNYVTQVLMSMVMMAMTLLMYSRSRASLRRIGEVLDTESTIADGPDSTATVTRGKVEFENVSFSYGGEEAFDALKNVSFTAQPGETVAIVGATGSGKTSLVQLIPRLYDVSYGRVLVDDRDVREYGLDALRESIGMVLQVNTLFSGTVESNMRWGKETATITEIEQALSAAQALDFVSEMESGIQAPVEQGGVNFSGGQKQRLCIARALVKEPKILILDDSTSAVDTTTEGRIRRALTEQHPDTTVILIAQRISSIRGADRILVLEDGSICASGTHDELLKESPIYQEIYQSQLEEGGDFDG